VALILVALISILSFLSRQPGFLTRAWLRLLKQGFGWGAYVVPVFIGAVGVWLIWRHFGEDLPEVDPIRVAGGVILFLGLLTIMQAGVAAAGPIGTVWINRTLADPASPDYNPDLAWQEAEACPVRPQEKIDQGWVRQAAILGSWDIARCGHGGGYVGALIQVTLMNLIGGLPVFIIALVMMGTGALMVTRKSLKDVIDFGVATAEKYRERREERRLAAEEDEEEEEDEAKAPVRESQRGKAGEAGAAPSVLPGRPSIVTGRGPGGQQPAPSGASESSGPSGAPSPAKAGAAVAGAGAAAGAATAAPPRPGAAPGGSSGAGPSSGGPSGSRLPGSGASSGPSGSGSPPSPTGRPPSAGGSSAGSSTGSPSGGESSRPGGGPSRPGAPSSPGGRSPSRRGEAGPGRSTSLPAPPAGVPPRREGGTAPLSRPGADSDTDKEESGSRRDALSGPPRPGGPSLSAPPSAPPRPGVTARPGSPSRPGSSDRPGSPSGGDRAERSGADRPGSPGEGSSSSRGGTGPLPGLPGAGSSRPGTLPGFGAPRPAPKPAETSAEADDEDDEDITFDDLARDPDGLDRAIEVDEDDPSAKKAEGGSGASRAGSGDQTDGKSGPGGPQAAAPKPASAPGASAPAPSKPASAADEDEDGGGEPEDDEPKSATKSAAKKAPEAASGGDDKKPSKPPRADGGKAKSSKPPKPEWKLPEAGEMLEVSVAKSITDEELRTRAEIIEQTLSSFGAPGRVVEVNHGPVITQFGVEPDYVDGRSGKRIKVKVGKINSLADDLALALAASSVRIEAPVPGKGYVGIEVPNAEPSIVGLRDVLDTPEFRNLKSPLKLALGQDVSGQPVCADLTAMPHLLIAGTTGSGKSVCVNGIICTMLMNCAPDQLKMIMVDPKRVELTNYNGIPHLMAPVVTELERIVGVLKWVQREMDDRYRKFAMAGARNITDYNQRIEKGKVEGDQLPYILVIVDELADLMMLAPDETERVITRLAQMARATGIHIIISTQRPSVDVVTGLIKANFPARIAFAVATGVDSRVILDMPGAEKLLGRGDMLFQAPDAPLPTRMQGVFVSDEEIQNITDFWRGQAEQYREAAGVEPDTPLAGRQKALFRAGDDDDEGDEVDDLFDEAVELVREHEKASISMLQRHLRIGYTRAARLIEAMEERDIVGPHEGGSLPRPVLGPDGEPVDEEE
jgi:S-DNA-T family DNA segregation ATPase FtsK/SpoIIIE